MICFNTNIICFKKYVFSNVNPIGIYDWYPKEFFEYNKVHLSKMKLTILIYEDSCIRINQKVNYYIMKLLQNISCKYI